ncbi:LYR motif-containing protein 4 [Halocaridina rubra]|uniref:LYR motif-containing protein 4 n=1 Tax=Halocaridina rubra TaxID=373956 RepID=A0AAN8WPY4_HALRR
MASGRREILNLYKAMLRESQKFTSYNYREYALQRIRDSFREGKTLSGEEVQEKLKVARDSLQIIKRQVVIGQLYSSPNLVIEK